MWRSLLHVAVRAVVCLLAISLIKIVLPGLGVGPRPGLHVHVHDCISWAMCFLNSCTCTCRLDSLHDHDDIVPQKENVNWVESTSSGSW